jgi:LysR family transcriptional regulator, glycine cleavage system transcriptional activator
MRRPLLDLPPLDLMRSFVAVARCMSITVAARELCVTQSAVSRQIRALEQRLHCTLFIRGHRSIELTSEGRRLFRTANPWLEQLAETIEELRPAEDHAAVTITASVGVSSLWLLPRIGAFQAAHPGVALRVVTSNRVLDLERDRIDLAIRYAAEADAPPSAIRLFGEQLVPVAHRSLGVTAIEDHDELRRRVLLELDDPTYSRLHWADWLKAADVGRARPAGIVRFNQYDQVVQAALAGQGVALGRIALVQPLLRAGQLTRASRRAPRNLSHGYWMVVRSQRVSEHAAALQRWILAEAATSVDDDVPPQRSAGKRTRLAGR